MADLVDHALELFERVRLGGLAHPVDGLDIGAHRTFDRVHHCEHAAPRHLAELAFDVSLAQRVAELVVGRVDAAFPACGNLGLAIEPLAKEGEVFVDEGLRRHRDERMNEAPAQIGLPIVKRERLERELEPFEETWIRDVQGAERRRAHLGEIRLPIE